MGGHLGKFAGVPPHSVFWLFFCLSVYVCILFNETDLLVKEIFFVLRVRPHKKI